MKLRTYEHLTPKEQEYLQTRQVLKQARAQQNKLNQERRLEKKEAYQATAKARVLNKTKLFKKPFQKSYTIAQRTKPRQSTSSAVVRVFGTRQSGSPQQANRPVGRPRGVYVHRSPFNGQPITAPQYYKELRLFRRQQQVFAQKNMEARMAQLARQGINPQQVQQMQTQPQPQFQQQQMPQPQQRFQPQMQQAQRPMQPGMSQPKPIWRSYGYQDYETDIMGNKRLVTRGFEQSFWN